MEKTIKECFAQKYLASMWFELIIHRSNQSHKNQFESINDLNLSIKACIEKLEMVKKWYHVNCLGSISVEVTCLRVIINDNLTHICKLV